MSMARPVGLVAALATASIVACSPSSETDAASGGQPSPLAVRCEADDGGFTLPDGFCAIVVTESLPGARHLEVADNGDLFVALRNVRTSRTARLEGGGVAVLRDSDGDGHADVVERWGENGGNDVLLANGFVYFAPNDAVLRYPLSAGSMRPSGPPDTIVSGLPDTQSHTAKSIALGLDGSLYVNIGSPSNACITDNTTVGSRGQDPCPQLQTRAGIWRFDANATGQTQRDGSRYATGMRNTVALRVHPGTGLLYGAIHGRDQLHGIFPDLYTVDQNAEKPSEEFVRVDEGSDYGWPYCYHDPEASEKYLAPEYGGDGTEVGRCADKDDPIIGFPGHWAPNDLEFYTGTQFPARYRGGAFIAFHGSWNRAPNPQDGYRVVFIPASGDPVWSPDGTTVLSEPGSQWEVFADGFRKEGDPERSARPVGLAMGPDGSLYISDSLRGRIWRVVYRG